MILLKWNLAYIRYSMEKIINLYQDSHLYIIGRFITRMVMRSISIAVRTWISSTFCSSKRQISQWDASALSISLSSDIKSTRRIKTKPILPSPKPNLHILRNFGGKFKFLMLEVPALRRQNLRIEALIHAERCNTRNLNSQPKFAYEALISTSAERCSERAALIKSEEISIDWMCKVFEGFDFSTNFKQFYLSTYVSVKNF